MSRPRHRGRPTAPAARLTALRALSACLKGADIQAALAQALAGAKGLDPRDAALATELCYGALRLKIRLDWLLSRYLRDAEALPAPMRLALAVAAYEIIRLDKIPAYASVDWCVQYVKGLSPALAKVANAVLRRIADLGPDADSPETYREPHDDRAAFLARYHASPSWLAQLWLDAYGDLAEDYLAATTAPPALGLRMRPGLTDEGKAAFSEGADVLDSLGTGFALGTAPDGLSALLEQGLVVRQSFAGQQAMHAIGAQDWPGPVWDCCCGRGGKSMLLADHGVGPILASDPSRARLRGLAAELRRLAITSVLPVRARADVPAPLSAPVPTILVDAPCSGLGVLSRRPDAKLKRTPADLDRLVDVQARILDSASKFLCAGGTLAYVTCTLNPAENGGQVSRFLARTPSFRLIREFQTPPTAPLGEFFYAALIQG